MQKLFMAVAVIVVVTCTILPLLFNSPCSITEQKKTHVEETNVMGFAKLIKTRKLILVRDESFSHKEVSEWKGKAKEISSLQKRTEVYENTIELSVPQLSRVEILQSFKEELTFVGNSPTECCMEGWFNGPKGVKVEVKRVLHFENGSWNKVIDVELPIPLEPIEEKTPEQPLKQQPPIDQRNQARGRLC